MIRCVALVMSAHRCFGVAEHCFVLPNGSVVVEHGSVATDHLSCISLFVASEIRAKSVPRGVH